MPPNNSRSGRREARQADEQQRRSRRSYYEHIKTANDSAIRHAKAESNLDRTQTKQQALVDRNPDEAGATVARWAWHTIILIAVVAIVIVDYLIIGGSLDYLFQMQPELANLGENLPLYKIGATIGIVLIETAIAVGIALLRERGRSGFALFMHYVIGIAIAATLSLFAFGLLSSKVKNDATVTTTEIAVLSSTDTALEPDIPNEKLAIVIGVCALCFVAHTFALLKGESIADAAALMAYGARMVPLNVSSKINRYRRDRNGAKAESAYRQAYDAFEEHNAEFPNDALPSVPSQQDPETNIPVMRLSPVAQRIIERLQNGVIERPAVNATEEADGEYTPATRPPASVPTLEGRGDTSTNRQTGFTPDANTPPDAGTPPANPGRSAPNAPLSAEEIVDAAIRDADGEL